MAASVTVWDTVSLLFQVAVSVSLWDTVSICLIIMPGGCICEPVKLSFFVIVVPVGWLYLSAFETRCHSVSLWCQMALSVSLGDTVLFCVIMVPGGCICQPEIQCHFVSLWFQVSLSIECRLHRLRHDVVLCHYGATSLYLSVSETHWAPTLTVVFHHEKVFDYCYCEQSTFHLFRVVYHSQHVHILFLEFLWLVS